MCVWERVRKTNNGSYRIYRFVCFFFFNRLICLVRTISFIPNNNSLQQMECWTHHQRQGGPTGTWSPSPTPKDPRSSSTPLPLREMRVEVLLPPSAQKDCSIEHFSCCSLVLGKGPPLTGWDTRSWVIGGRGWLKWQMDKKQSGDMFGVKTSTYPPT